MYLCAYALGELYSVILVGQGQIEARNEIDIVYMLASIIDYTNIHASLGLKEENVEAAISEELTVTEVTESKNVVSKANQHLNEMSSIISSIFSWQKFSSFLYFYYLVNPLLRFSSF
jgi:predicted transcriptional regulator YdeE